MSQFTIEISDQLGERARVELKVLSGKIDENGSPAEQLAYLIYMLLIKNRHIKQAES